jgi:hypothetical protein
MTDVLTIDGVEITLAKGEIINSIQQIGFARPIGPYKTIDSIAKLQFSLQNILIIKYIQMLKIHNNYDLKVFTGNSGL